jgi:carotenoid isomerooxygenase
MNDDPDYATTFRGRPQRFVLPTKVPRSAKKTANLVTLRGSRAEAYATRQDAVRVIPEPLCDLGCEVPRINYERVNGKHYNYFYAICSDVDLEQPGTVECTTIKIKR